MKIPLPQTKCVPCDGTGQIKLTPAQASVYRVIARHGPVFTGEILSKIRRTRGVKLAAVSNMVKWLMNQGLVRKYNGRYSIKEQKP